MSDEVNVKTELLGLVVRVTFLSAVSYYTMRWLMDSIDPTRKRGLAAEKKAKALMRNLGLDENIGLTDHEMIIAANLVDPESIDTTWDDIAGLDNLVTELRETVILPIQKRELFRQSKLTQAPKGVLLHGPPGCGKTMIAKATAKEAGAQFINLDAAALTDKWYGESQKLAAAVFTLAQKISPCIVFIDEIDSLLRSRNSNDHEATAMIKTQFMQLWDGLPTDSSCVVVVMGATNQPKAVDRAILRRMPATFHVGLPVEAQRKAILKEVLKIEKVAADLDLNQLAKMTEGFSGSDLRELCRLASVYRIRELSKATSGDGENSLRDITQADLMSALRKQRESKVYCGAALPMNAVGDLD